MPTIKNVVYGTGKNQPIYNVETALELINDSSESTGNGRLLLLATGHVTRLRKTHRRFGALKIEVASDQLVFGFSRFLGDSGVV